MMVAPSTETLTFGARACRFPEPWSHDFGNIIIPTDTKPRISSAKPQGRHQRSESRGQLNYHHDTISHPGSANKLVNSSALFAPAVGRTIRLCSEQVLLRLTRSRGLIRGRAPRSSHGSRPGRRQRTMPVERGRRNCAVRRVGPVSSRSLSSEYKYPCVLLSYLCAGQFCKGPWTYPLWTSRGIGRQVRTHDGKLVLPGMGPKTSLCPASIQRQGAKSLVGGQDKAGLSRRCQWPPCHVGEGSRRMAAMRSSSVQSLERGLARHAATTPLPGPLLQSRRVDTELGQATGTEQQLRAVRAWDRRFRNHPRVCQERQVCCRPRMQCHAACARPVPTKPVVGLTKKLGSAPHAVRICRLF